MQLDDDCSPIHVLTVVAQQAGWDTRPVDTDALPDDGDGRRPRRVGVACTATLPDGRNLTLTVAYRQTAGDTWTVIRDERGNAAAAYIVDPDNEVDQIRQPVRSVADVIVWLEHGPVAWFDAATALGLPARRRYTTALAEQARARRLDNITRTPHLERYRP